MSIFGRTLARLNPHAVTSGKCLECYLRPSGASECPDRLCLTCCARTGHRHGQPAAIVAPVIVFTDNRRSKVVNRTDNRQVHNHYYGAREAMYREPEPLPPAPRRQALREAIPSQAIARRQASAEQFAARLIELTGANCSVAEVLENPALFQRLTLAAAREQEGE